MFLNNFISDSGAPNIPISEEQADDFRSSIGADKVIVVNAINGDGIEEGFTLLVRQILEAKSKFQDGHIDDLWEGSIKITRRNFDAD